MKRHRLRTGREPGTITGIAEATAERVRLNGDLLQGLAHAVAAHQQREHKFRLMALSRLARIESTVSAIHGCQLATQPRTPGYEATVEEDAKAAEEFISRKSGELGLAMVKYIYAEAAGQEPPPRQRGRNWSEWEI